MQSFCQGQLVLNTGTSTWIFATLGWSCKLAGKLNDFFGRKNLFQIWKDKHLLCAWEWSPRKPQYSLDCFVLFLKPRSCIVCHPFQLVTMLDLKVISSWTNFSTSQFLIYFHLCWGWMRLEVESCPFSARQKKRRLLPTHAKFQSICKQWSSRSISKFLIGVPYLCGMYRV